MEPECFALRHLMSPRSNKTDLAEDGKNGQKENYVESKGVSSHKCDHTSSMLCGKKSLGPDQLQITPSKPEEGIISDPLTPTANLKLLINAASPDIRVREMKKILFCPIENENVGAVLDSHSQLDVRDDAPSGEFDQKPSRKQKSLSLLCQKFLALYPINPGPSETISISLDEVSTNLGVERRRIYDIVNVLESLKLVSRVAKNQYVWHGRRQLERTLGELHALGQRQRYHLQVDRQPGPAARTEEPPESCEEGGDEDVGLGPAGTRKDKSLRIMSQKFVMLFLVSKTRVITLDLAAKILIEECQDVASHSKYKTKVRRLYDIANVLTSLNLIAKVHVREERGRKPAFKWIGPTAVLSNGDLDSIAGLSLPEFHGASGQTSQGTWPKPMCHVPFGMVPIPAQWRVSSAPSSPGKEDIGLMQEMAGGTKTAGDDAAVCRVQAADEKRQQPGIGPKGGAHVSEAGPAHPESPSGSIPLARFYSSTGQPNASLSSLSPTPQMEPGDARPQAALSHLRGLPQAPLVMLCRGPTPTEIGARGPGSPARDGILGKRRMDDAERRMPKRDRKNEAEAPKEDDRDQVARENPSEGYGLKPPAVCPVLQSQGDTWSPSRTLPSHYLYVPNSAGLNSLNLLLSSGHVSSPLALTPNAVSAMAVPCVLLPSPGLPLIAGGRFGVPAVVSPAHMVLGGRTVTPPESGRSPTVPSSPVQPPPGSRAQPRTPKEVGPAGSRAFFQTPGTLACKESRSSPRRVSAQRRLDIGQPSN
ncbi:transcription factor E2F7-like [Brienomyrus brachyistius]|uniref:transcription factor E2F7-like n=1 Tax=Brienomyrus brachyistius TaxID=42636 RepID=UPI0020B3A69D|nr:transcription factor E2F7-like [Brienomyrus brachyistius]XP_048865370.1 transcription factor E2F7-like [Brienomyrus brachyistius]XP_048865371.1 transcription factor E2F7-like [Brienomyrus brachyistius]